MTRLMTLALHAAAVAGLLTLTAPVTSTSAEATLLRTSSPMRMHMAAKARGEAGLFSSNQKIRAFFLERDRNGAGRG